MFDVGRLCVKTRGRDAGKKCVIVDKPDETHATVDGLVRRRNVNIKHLEPLKETIKISKGASHATVISEFKKFGIEIKETKKKESKSRPKTQKKKKTPKPQKQPEKKAEKKKQEKPKKDETRKEQSSFVSQKPEVSVKTEKKEVKKEATETKKDKKETNIKENPESTPKNG